MKHFICLFVLISTLSSCSDNSIVVIEEVLIPSSGVGENVEHAVTRFGGSGDDRIYDVIKVDDGLVIVGQTNSVDGDFEGVNVGDFRYNDSSAFVLKVGLDKELEWVKAYGGDGESLFDYVFEDGDGYTVFGRSNSASGNFEGLSSFKAVLDSRGELVSVYAIPEDLSYAFVSDFISNSNLIQNYSEGTIHYLATGSKHRNVSLLYIDENLDLTLSRTYEGESNKSDWGVAGLSLLDGFLVAGNTQSNEGVFEGLNPDLLDNSSTNVFLMKTDRAGEIEWLHTYGGRERDELIALTKGGNDNYIIAGNNQTNDGDFEGYGGEFQRNINQIFMISINASGETEWIKTYGGSEREWLESLVATPDGGFLMSGLSYSNDGHFFLRKVNQDGEKEWVKRFNIGLSAKATFSYQNKSFVLFGSNEAAGENKFVLIQVDQNGNLIE